MVYYALVFFALTVGILALGFMGVIPGAAGLANLALLISLILFAVSTIRDNTHMHRYRH